MVKLRLDSISSAGTNRHVSGSYVDNHLQHQVWLLTLRGALHLVSTPESFRSVLDVGCGTGVWALAIASMHTNVQVTATDLTPPTSIVPPANVKFIKADADTEWALGKFDFIHGRMITSGIHDWQVFLSRCWEHLEFGGVLELLDICHPFGSDDPSSELASAVIRFGHAAEKCWGKKGLDYRASMKHVDRLTKLGFENITETELKWPLGEWASTDREKKMGKLTLSNFRTFLEMAGVKILTSDSEMSPQTAQVLVDEALKELSAGDSGSKKLYLSM
ncbi:hypothetical protein HYFRA_00004250 [Hymenoscyphus fraxineus]|uniref:S-adenosyl-L-methionine-dependent methyltransferase n=1 Tax=Hymenoscyphus fraxineus TaxID=746836 RepID=A0A9N9KPU1_9HELO|nr:hypothetical protein HYFRA_00004250 [Hymenoscyphus fraxineus]